MGITRSLGEGCRKDFSNKLFPRLSHRVCRLLSSADPVLQRKLSSLGGGGLQREEESLDVGKETGI